ncbi:ubiquinol-cytochrome-c reductase complex assembly factor 6 [Euwallacea similis]|uniref:ubiquinol-cytochrome-c reductase complex assembly factor 6 n=1 Tax=Euwallacea similis TaxID=1736056 RepID=UPI00344DCADE
MPAGVSWSQYIKFTTCALLSMFAGAQVVHVFYRPLDDLEVYIDKLKNKTMKSE